MSNSKEHLRWEAFSAYTITGSYAAAARHLNLPVKTVEHRAKMYEKLELGKKVDLVDEVGDTLLEQKCEQIGINPEDVIGYWHKTDDMSIFVKNKVKAQQSYLDVRDSVVAEMKAYAPVYTPRREALPAKREHLLIIDPADVHIGKLAIVEETGFTYNIEIAKERMIEGCLQLAIKAYPHGIDKFVLVIGNDILHIDNQSRTTTSGTRQDTDGQIWQMYKAAKEAYITIIEELAKYADVHVIDCRSNHDHVLGWTLADTIGSWFAKHPNVKVDINPIHRKYIVYGHNLIGFTHGDGADEKKLPAIMMQEARAYMSTTRYSYFYTHHLHHKIRRNYSTNGSQQMEKDEIGVTIIRSGDLSMPENSVYVETIRSPSPPDAWHHKKGYINRPAIEAFLHHVDDGQCGRITQYF